MGGFYHGSVNSDSYVVLAGGGYKSVNDFLLSQDHYKTSPGAGTAGTSSATSGSTLSVPYVTVNANGHVTGYGTHTHTVTGFLTSHLSVTNSNPNIKYGNTMTIGSVGGTNLQITLPNNEGTSDFTDKTELLTSYASNNGFADTNAPGVIYRRKAVSMYNYLVSKGFLTAQDHYKTSPGAGTAGTSSATSGSTLSVPYVTINANGHVTGYGTHTHTITGFLTALDHYKTSPGAGTAGTSSATSGSSLAVPYVTINANGHVTGYGTHTHTITGFATTDTDTWRKVQLNGTDKLGTGTGTNPLNIKAGTGMSITESSGTFTFNCTVSGSSDVYWKDVKDKIRGGNEFNIVPSGYNSTMWFNYQSDANTTVTVSEYIFGNGSHSASASIKSGTVYPGSNASYDIGKTGSRWNWGYFNSGILVGGTSYTGPHTNAVGTTIANGYIEMNETNPYIDFHRSGYYTSDYSSRLIHWNNQVRLKYENSDTTYSGYVLTCEGNHHNPVILGIFDLRRYGPNSTSWSLDNICGPCYFSLLNSWGSDVSYHDSNSYWTIPSNLLRVEINSTLGANYTTKSTVKAAACIGTVMTRWINNHPVVANRSHEDWQGCSVECLCTNKAPGLNLYYDSQSPGKYIYITGSRPWGYDDGSNGLAMDQFRQTGNLSYQRVRFVVYGWLE